MALLVEMVLWVDLGQGGTELQIWGEVVALNVCGDGGAGELAGCWLGGLSPLEMGEQFGWSLGLAWKTEPEGVGRGACESSSVVTACSCHKLVIRAPGGGTEAWQMWIFIFFFIQEE